MPTLPRPGIPAPLMESVPTSDVLTKLKLLESELQAEAEAARNRSGKIAQGWGNKSSAGGGGGARPSAAGSSTKGL